MQKQQELLVEHFEKLGGKVSLQEFRAKNPLGGTRADGEHDRRVASRSGRIAFCSRPTTTRGRCRTAIPTRSPRTQGTFVGANDGASGMAVLMELAHLMPKLDAKYGVDFVLFDGEELVYEEGRDPYCLGSTWFAQQYAAKPPEHKYRWGVVLDMVGDADLQIYQEQQSFTWRNTRPLVNEIWNTAKRLGVDEFIPRVGYLVHGRSCAAAQHRQDSDLRHHRLRLSGLAHRGRHAAALLGHVAGESGVGRVRVAEDGTMRVESRGSRVESQRSVECHDCRRHHFADAAGPVGLAARFASADLAARRAIRRRFRSATSGLRGRMYRRRMQASAMIGVMGAAIGIWPLFDDQPRPWALLLYTAILLAACAWIMAAGDARCLGDAATFSPASGWNSWRSSCNRRSRWRRDERRRSAEAEGSA